MPAKQEDVEGAGAEITKTETTATEDLEYPHGVKLLLLMASIFISMFLVALVGTVPEVSAPELRCVAVTMKRRRSIASYIPQRQTLETNIFP